jgi:molecular chaperone HscB
MTSDPIPVRAVSTLECRNCGAGAPVDEHFCPQCSRILSIGRHGNYFVFFGLPRKLTIAQPELERRYRELSRKFHPDYYYNASPAERLASLERSSYLNDAYRALRHPMSRIEHLLAIEGLPAAKSETGTAKVPPGLLEEVFALNEELDEIRELRESGADPSRLRDRLDAARKPIEVKREEHEREVDALCTRWDRQLDANDPVERRATLEALRERLLERNYITNLLTAIDREAAGVGLQTPVSSPHDEIQGTGDGRSRTEDRRL